MLAAKQEGPAAEAASPEQRLAVEMCVDVQQDEQARHAPGELLLHVYCAKFCLLTCLSVVVPIA